MVRAHTGGCAGAAAPEDGFPFPAPKPAALVQAEAAAPCTRVVLGPGPRGEGESQCLWMHMMHWLTRICSPFLLPAAVN